jgi:hypothetical protein
VRVIAYILTVVLAVAGLQAMAGRAHADEVTVSQDLLRSGWDPSEPGLSPAVVSGKGFGQLFSTPVNGQVYAQPLVVGSNVLVATDNDWVYSLDAVTGAVKWSLSLGPGWPASALGCADLTPEIGVTSTPVYDPSTGTVYLTAVVNDGSTVYKPHVYLFALNASTGAIDWKQAIQGSPVNDPSHPFDPLTERQRPGLMLMGGSVYMAFGSYCDERPYTGYVAGVNTATKALTMWSDEAGTTNDQAGVWESGDGLMSDGPGRIILSTGNGVSPAPGHGTSPPAALGDAVVRLGVQSDGTLAAQDFFSPANAPTLDVNDQDFGSGGPVGLPFGTTAYPHLLVQAGKDGRVFLLNRDNLGGRETGTNHTDNPLSVAGPYQGQWGHPAAFGGSGGADYVYYSGTGAPGDVLRALKFNSSGTKPTLQDVANSASTMGPGSGSPVVTSNGSDPASAVVWEVSSTANSGVNGRLQAFDAVPQKVGSALQLKQIWSAPIGTASKFSVPATDNGRVYVGTRDGHVLGFGPGSPLSGAAVPFGQVAVGSSGNGMATITLAKSETQNVTISSITTSAPFSVTAPTLPTTLAPGQSLSVPVTFTPTAPGGATGSVSFATNLAEFPTVGVGLSGTGTKPGFYASPGTLAFGTVPTGTTKALTADITNGGTTPETVTATSPPSSPFSVTGLPAPNTQLAPGASTTLTINYKPTAAQNDTGSLSVTGADGTATVNLTGTGVTGQGTLTASPAAVSFGSVSLGQQAAQSIDVSNSGTLPMTITGFRAPTVPFGTPVPVTTGITLSPGDDLQIPVTFTPQSLGSVGGTYTLTANDGHNPAQTLSIPVSGTGVAPASGGAVPSPGGGWTLNGSAQMSGTSLQLTQAVHSQAGSAVYYQPLASNGLHAQFTAQLNGGSGADGMTFGLLDASKATPSSVGGSGGQLGFGGLPGVAVTLDTFKDAGYPSANFVGLATSTAGGSLSFVRTSTNVPNLRTGTHTIGVTASGGTVTVTVDGKQALSAAVALPPSVLATFSGGTGGLDDVHAVRGVSITDGGTTLPPPGGGWSYNGAAGMSGADTTLTHAVQNQRGSVVYPAAVTTNGLRVQFNAQIGGGTGADGMTFALLNPAKTTQTALGADGGGLGYGGLSGVAVTLDTFKDAGYPSDNFIGIATGTGTNASQLKFAQTVRGIGKLRVGTHSVEVTYSGGVLVVYLDGAQVLQRAISLPATSRLAFTAGTGGSTDVHTVRDVAISG